MLRVSRMTSTQELVRGLGALVALAPLALVFRLGVMPMSLFSGAFFPITQLPWSVRWVAFLSPLWHGNELARGAAIGGLSGWQALGHLVFLGVLTISGFLVMRKRFDLRLVV